MGSMKSILTLILAWTFATPLFAGRNQAISVVIVLDISGSMEGNDPNYLSWDAARLLIDLLGPGDEAAVLMYSSGIIRQTPLITIGEDQKAGKQRLKSIFTGKYRGGTKTIQTLEYARSMLKQSKAAKKDRTFSIMLLTDGQDELFDQGEKRALKIYGEFRQKLRQDEIRLFPIYLSKQDLSFSKKLQEITDETVIPINTPEQLPEKFAYIFGQLYECIVKPLTIEGGDHAFDMHELSIEAALIAAGKFENSMDYTVHTPTLKQVSSKNIAQEAEGYAASENSYRVLKLGKTLPGKYKLTLDKAPDKALVIQIPDIKLQVDWGDFNLLDKKVTVQRAAIYTKNGTEVYQNENFYHESKLNLVIRGNKSQYSLPLRDDGIRPDSKSGDRIYAGHDFLTGFGQFSYYVELEHPLFKRRSKAKTVAFNESVTLTTPNYAKDSIFIAQGDVLAVPIRADKDSQFGERNEILKVELQKGANPGWEKINLRNDFILLGNKTNGGNIEIETDMGRILDFGWSAVPLGNYSGTLRLISAGGEQTSIPLEFRVENNPKLFWYGLLAWGAILLFLCLFLGTFMAKKFPRRYYVMDIRDPRHFDEKIRPVHSTVFPFVTSRHTLGSLGTVFATSRSRDEVELRYQVDGQTQQTSINTSGQTIYNKSEAYYLREGKDLDDFEMRDAKPPTSSSNETQIA